MPLREEKRRVAREASALADDWHAFLERRTSLVGSEVVQLASRLRALIAPATSADLGGLAHHLEVLASELDVVPPGRDALTRGVKNLAEMCWQLEQESRGPPPPLPPSPPPLLTAGSSPRQGPSGGVPEPPPLVVDARPGGRAPRALDEVPEPSAPVGALRPSPANLAVADMFDLRAPARVPKDRSNESGPRARGPLLGLGGRGRQPPAVGVGLGGLAELDDRRSSSQPKLDEDLEARLERVRSPAVGGAGSRRRRSAARDSAPSPWGDDSRDPERRPVGSPRPLAAPGATRSPLWWAVGGVGLVAVGVFVILFGARSPNPSQALPATDEQLSALQPALPKSRLLGPEERLRALLAEVHASGGTESPELADLIDEEAALIREVLARRCEADVDTCESAVPPVAGTLDPAAGPQLVRQLFGTTRLDETLAPRDSRPPPWLAGLKQPAIGAEPHAKVKRWLEYFTQHAVGRERFQTLLFRCGEHQERIDQALVRRGLPRSLMALVITESGCVQDIESPVGARGLWQFMPATARAYHLRVKKGVVDERISPPKASDAAARFLADLKRKMGSWELTLASYNMGPFGVAARRRRAGFDATYWQLAEAGLLPEETANYVPRIQAYALILENLEHFGFSVSQRRAPVPTADFEAPAGTRLSQVARAAGTSLAYLRTLNPDVVGPTVPSLSGGPFVLSVPREVVFRAREAIGALLSSGDEADLCVSSEFDWGSERFTPRMAAECR